jgi:hypothetical protein
MLRLLCAIVALAFLAGWMLFLYAALGPWGLTAGAGLIVAATPAQLAWMRRGRL